MKRYELSQIGTFHINHNEDANCIIEIGADKVLFAVMDGCSMGKESHFASTLIAKILRKIATEMSYKAFIEKVDKQSNDYLKDILNQLFKELGQIKNQLFLETEEVLSTLILGVFDSEKNEIELITIGDGLICCDGKFYEYEQNDKPDYLGYHLSEDFEDWFSMQKQKLMLRNVKDLSISTDGIFTFKQFDNRYYDKIQEEEIVEYLLIDTEWNKYENMLGKKLSEIENRFGLKPSDDLTILRIINE